MRMLPALAFAAATLLGTGAAFAGPFGPGGQIKTTENSYESLVLQPGDVLNGIFNVAQINASSGISYTYGAGNMFLVGSFTGFQLESTSAIPGGTRLFFTGGALNYYSFGADPFTTFNLTGGGVGNQASALANIATGTLELALVPQLIDATHTLTIDVFGGLNNFAAAATSTVYLDIVGGASEDLFDKDSLTNSFTAMLADASYQGSANTLDCDVVPNAAWQVCGTNHATLNVIPEPLTVSLFGAGLAGAAALRRRKAKKA